MPKTRVVNIRTKEPYDVYIGRPSIWGNPFKIGHQENDGHIWSREEVIQLFRAWILTNHPELIEQARKELKGKILGCFCPPQPCHGDVWIEFAEGDD